MAQSLAHFFAGILVGLAGAVLFFRPRTRKQATASLNSQLERLLRQLSEAEQQRSKNRSDIDELAKLLKGYQEDRQDLERAFNGIEQSFRAVRAMPMALRDGVGDLLRRHHDSILDEVRTSLQAIQAESGSGGDPRDLQALLEREAALRAEAYRISDAVTDIIGKMEECGDELVAELSHYQTGRRGYDGSRSLKGLIRAVIRFSNFWTRMRSEVDKLALQNKGFQKRLQESSRVDH